ncbi:MAG TPA: hypothetical protein VGD76_01825, partial [Ramlibacter sp.]
LNQTSIEVLAGYKNVPVENVVPCTSFQDFDDWTNHGADRRKVAQALAENWAFRNDADRALAEAWLRQAETAAAVKAAESAALGAMRSARWTLWAAIAAAAGALSTLGQAFITATCPPAPPQAKTPAAVPKPAASTVGSLPPTTP